MMIWGFGYDTLTLNIGRDLGGRFAAGRISLYFKIQTETEPYLIDSKLLSGVVKPLAFLETTAPYLR
jgi:hypothetical protein